MDIINEITNSNRSTVQLPPVRPSINRIRDNSYPRDLGIAQIDSQIGRLEYGVRNASISIAPEATVSGIPLGETTRFARESNNIANELRARINILENQVISLENRLRRLERGY